MLPHSEVLEDYVDCGYRVEGIFDEKDLGHINRKSVLASAVHILKLERYRED